MKNINVTVVKDFPGYGVTTDGKVYSQWKHNGSLPRLLTENWVELKPTIGNHGYKVVGLSKSGQSYKRLVHRLILETFISECPINQEARHLNGIRTDARLENLAWGTHAENKQDRVRHGNLRIALTQEIADEIRLENARGILKRKEIAKKFDISYTHVSLILQNYYWKKLIT